MEKKTKLASFLPNDITGVSLELYDDYIIIRLNRIRVFQFLLIFFTDIKYAQISDRPFKFCQVRIVRCIGSPSTCT